MFDRCAFFRFPDRLWWLTLALVCLSLTPACKQGRRDPSSAKRTPKAAALASLPYVNWRPVAKRDVGKRGARRLTKAEPTPGYNLWTSRPRYNAVLTDNAGQVVHRWQHDRLRAVSTDEARWMALLAGERYLGWHHVEAGPDGSLFVVMTYRGILKLSWNSEVLWSSDIAAHHDVAPLSGGDTLAIEGVRRQVEVPGGRSVPVLDSVVARLDGRGVVKERLSLLDLLRNSPSTKKLVERRLRWVAKRHEMGLVAEAREMLTGLERDQVETMGKMVRDVIADRFVGSAPGAGRWPDLWMLSRLRPTDLLHANSLEVLDRDVPRLGNEGDWLVSVRELDLVVVLDPTTKKVRWSFGPGRVKRQHHPTVTATGRVLLFDNGDAARPHSRVIEVDPGSGKVAWSYTATPKEDFFSPIRGACQRLSADRVLITDSERGMAMEVNRVGEVVWEYFNPDVARYYGQLARAPIYRLVRLPGSSFPDLFRKTAR